MSRHRLTVVLAQAQGRKPAHRAIEESVVAALILEGGLDVSVVPHLGDLDPSHTGRLFLESVVGDMVVLSWLEPKECFGVLGSSGINGHFVAAQPTPPAKEADTGSVKVADRSIYCLDLRSSKNHEAYVVEVRRIAQECRQRRLAHDNSAPRQPALVQLGVEAVAGGPSESKLDRPTSTIGDNAIKAAGDGGLDVSTSAVTSVPKRRAQEQEEPKDDLDKLIDTLDSLNL